MIRSIMMLNGSRGGLLIRNVRPQKYDAGGTGWNGEERRRSMLGRREA
jgi:hypothetical protein